MRLTRLGSSAGVREGDGPIVVFGPCKGRTRVEHAFILHWFRAAFEDGDYMN